MRGDKLDVSIIICTKDRPSDLVRCLENIIETRINFEYREIIVVDSSSGELRRINQKNVEKLGGKYIFEYRKGLSNARNTGIRSSSSDIIVFADDDFIVDKNWIKALIENYDNPDIVCCTGNMPPYRDDSVSDIFEESITFERGNKRRIFTKEDISMAKFLGPIMLIGKKRLRDKTPVPWVIGAGFCSFNRHIFDIIGYFDPELGTGTPSKGGEDLDIFYRIIKSGYKIIYEPKAVIYHNHRKNLDDILDVAYNNGWGSRTFIGKYYKDDLFMLVCHFGYFSLLTLSLIKSIISNNVYLGRMVYMELKGFLKIR